MNIHSYPKVYAVGHSAVLELFMDDYLLVEEKVDGSQFSFGKIDGRIEMRSHGAEVFMDEPSMFKLATETVKALEPKLHEGWVYRAEFLQKPKHNALAYSRVPNYNLILFDVNTGDEIYLSRADKESEAARLGLDIVPVLYEGPIKSADQVLGLLERESILGGVKIEGIVIKNYERFGIDKKVLMGKYVSEHFKEVNHKSWKAANPGGTDIIQLLGNTMRNDRRWEKAVERLRDNGELENDPRDIGKLMKAVQDDVMAEERDFIVAKLLQWGAPKILRIATAGLPEWYKARLLNSAFAKEGLPIHRWEPDFSEGEPPLDSKVCGFCGKEHE